MHKKIVLVSNSNSCTFYEARGLKITRTIEAFNFDEMLEHHERRERKMLQQSTSKPMHGYELRNFPQDLDREDFCSLVVEKLGRLLPEFDEVIIVAEPTALGDIRQCLSKEQKKKVTLEVPKDIDQSNVHQIERTIFGK